MKSHSWPALVNEFARATAVTLVAASLAFFAYLIEIGLLDQLYRAHDDHIFTVHFVLWMAMYLSIGIVATLPGPRWWFLGPFASALTSASVYCIHTSSFDRDCVLVASVMSVPGGGSFAGVFVGAYFTWLILRWKRPGDSADG
jgi:hypothetical protein